MGRTDDRLQELATLSPQKIWDGVLARSVHGDRITMAVVELEPGAVVPEHRHDQEQLGIVLLGTVTFRIADEERELGPGGTWRIPGNTAHAVQAGTEGAVVVDVFAPVRADWETVDRLDPQTPRWP